jgi:hypothetical protein
MAGRRRTFKNEMRVTSSAYVTVGSGRWAARRHGFAPATNRSKKTSVGSRSQVFAKYESSFRVAGVDHAERGL